MKTHNNTRNACILTVVLAMGTGAALAQTTITGTAGGSDSWNDLANWNAGVPSGAIDAIVSGGVWAQVSNVATPAYSGSLTLNANATLTMACSGAGCGSGIENAVLGTSGITMNAGSEIQVNMNIGVDFPAITLLGDAKLSSLFGASDWETDNYSAITGAHTLTLEHFNGHAINLNAANSFSELIADTSDRWYLHATAAGSLGTGNVTINPRPDGRSASLYFDANDAMADTATLTLNGSPGQGGFSGNGSDYVILNADDTIAALYVYGVQQPAGIYTNSETWISGSGTLTVLNSGSNLFCNPANSHSGGGFATLDTSTFSGPGFFHLEAIDGPPDQFAYFLVSGSFADPGLTVSQGQLCLGAPQGRYSPAAGGSLSSIGQFDGAGVLQNLAGTSSVGTGFDVPAALPSPPGGVIAGGDTWYFQLWYRDGAASNFSDGIAVTF
ncbi:MAG TPA: hypothetical protein EYQ25_04830 [Planctomycetes bacterium]|nr:hypothetical protein [Planctomycetota bacterium]